MTKILHIETATKVCSVALSENGSLIGLAEINEDSFAHGEQLTVLISNLLAEKNLSSSDLDAVSVSAGPGSYTGLRIGVSTAKGLCYALQIPLISVDTLISMTEVAKQKYSQTHLCAMIDARRMEVFSTILNTQTNVVMKPSSADVLDEQTYAEFEPLVCFGDGAPKMQDMWKDRAIQFDLDLLPSASGQVSIAFAKFQANQFEDVVYFEPAYLKEFYQAPNSK